MLSKKGLLFFVILSISQYSSAETSTKPVDISSFQSLIDVYSSIKTYYVDDVKDETLIKGAIKGMMSSLDPHSSYMSKEESKKLYSNINGEYSGIGIVISSDNKLIMVGSTIKDSPAQKAGIKKGDIIIKIDNTEIKGVNALQNALDSLAKKENTVFIQIKREEKLLSYKLNKEIIKKPAVSSKVIEDKYLYIEISMFQKGITKDISDIISNNPDTKGILIDLRGNPGGLLNESVSLADLFLEKGVIVSTRGHDKKEHIYYSEKGDIAKNIPLVVIIDNESASAAEIFAGAIQDRQRGVVVGEKSYGKGSVQNILELNDGSSIKLTTSRYYTPNGNSIQARGITPDITFYNAQLIDDSKVKKRPLEKDLDNHLNNDTKEIPEEKTNLIKDYFLTEAINIMKTLLLKRG